MEEHRPTSISPQSVRGVYWLGVGFLCTFLASLVTGLVALFVGASLLNTACPFLLYHCISAAIVFRKTQQGPHANWCFQFDTLLDYFAVALVEFFAVLPVDLGLPYLLLGVPLYCSFGFGLCTREKREN